MMALPFLLAVSNLSPAGCLSLDSETVLARDLTSLVPAFEKLPGDFLLGFVASSGTPRIFKGADLERLARSRGVELHDLPDVCVARRTFVPQPAQVREVMLASLGIPGAKIEIRTMSQRPAPSGELIFPRSGIEPGLQSEVVWGGYVRYGENGKFPVWVRARITAALTRVVAIADLPPGKPIQKNQVRLESCEDSPLDSVTARTLEDVIAYLPKSTLRAASPIRKTQLDPPADVLKGELVTVDVFAGAAHLSLKARAEAAGILGSVIQVRNLSSGKDFPAQITGKGQVTVQ